MKWTHDAEGDYLLRISEQRHAWIAKSAVSKNQHPWYGSAYRDGAHTQIKGWSLRAAKLQAEGCLK